MKIFSEQYKNISVFRQVYLLHYPIAIDMILNLGINVGGTPVIYASEDLRLTTSHDRAARGRGQALPLSFVFI